MAVVYSLMARSIIVHQTPGGYLILPFAVKLLTVQWVGWFLARFVVDCNGFENEMGRIKRPLGWTLFVSAIAVVAFVWSEDFQPDASRLWNDLVDSRLVWIVVADWIGLAVLTAPEVLRFQPGRGRFVWSSAQDVNLRVNALAGAFLLAWFLGIPSMVFLPERFNAVALLSWLAAAPGREAWAMLALLLFVDLLALELRVWSHRRARRTAPVPD